MKTNPLYSLTQSLIVENFFLEGNLPIHSSTVEGQNYFRIPVKITDIPVRDLNLVESHISVYKEYDPSKPMLSTSHFTCRFVDLEGQSFRLHIYLNKQDKLTAEPVWQLEDDLHNFEMADKPEEFYELVQCVMNAMLPVLSKIRQQRVDKINRLTKEYHALEQECSLLSENWSENRDLYLEKADQIIDVLAKLKEVTHSRYYGRLIHYFNLLKNQDFTPEKEIAPEPIAKSKTPKETRKQVKSTQLADRKGKGKVVEEKDWQEVHRQYVERKLEKIALNIEKIALNIEKLKACKVVNAKIGLINKIETAISDIELNDSGSLRAETIMRLQGMDKFNIQQAKNLLQLSLLKGQFEDAQGLSRFYDQISPDILSIALNTRNSKLLAFLVSELDFQGTTLPVTVNKNHYQNSVVACVRVHTNERPMVDCLSVLLANGADLLLCEAPNKPPLAYEILRNPDNTLNQALSKHSEITTGNSCFYQQLIKGLRLYIQRNHLPTDELKQIKDDITFYTSKFKEAKFSREYFRPAVVQEFKELEAIAAEYLGREFSKRLEHDSDIIRAKDELTSLVNRNIRFIKANERQMGTHMALNSIARDDTEKLKKGLLNLDGVSVVDYNATKENVLRYFDLLFGILNKAHEHHQIVLRLKTRPAIHGRRNRAQKRELARATVLEKELRDAQQLLPANLVSNVGFLNQLTTFQSQLDDLKGAVESLQGMFSLFGELAASSSGQGEGSIMDGDESSDPNPCQMQ